MQLDLDRARWSDDDEQPAAESNLSRRAPAQRVADRAQDDAAVEIVEDKAKELLAQAGACRERSSNLAHDDA